MDQLDETQVIELYEEFIAPLKEYQKNLEVFMQQIEQDLARKSRIEMMIDRYKEFKARIFGGSR